MDTYHKDPQERQLLRQPIVVSDISVYICLIDIRSKSKEQLNERRAGLSTTGCCTLVLSSFTIASLPDSSVFDLEGLSNDSSPVLVGIKLVRTKWTRPRSGGWQWLKAVAILSLVGSLCAVLAFSRLIFLGSWSGFITSDCWPGTGQLARCREHQCTWPAAEAQKAPGEAQLTHI